MKKLLLIAFLTVALVFTLVACTNEEPKETTGETVADTTPGTVGESETQLPESETQSPESETEPPESETEPPESETEPPESETEPPESETEPPESETEPPETDPPAPADPFVDVTDAGVINKSIDVFHANGQPVSTNGGADIWLFDRDNTWTFAAGEAHDSVELRGWIGFPQAIQSFGYYINSTDNVTWGDFTTTTEDGILAAGGEFASRFIITADLSALEAGEHTVGFVVKLADGTLARLLAEVKIIIEEVPPAPEDPFIDVADAYVINKSIDVFHVNGSLVSTNGNADIWLFDRDNTWTFAAGEAHDSVELRGWIGFPQAIQSFGYYINSTDNVTWGDFTTTTEDGILAAGGEFASRFIITADLSALEAGEYTVGFVAKLADGTQVRLLQEITVVIETPASAPEMWDVKKDIVTHQSFDGIHKNGTEESILSAGCIPSDWNKIAAMNATDTSLHYFGWVGVKGELGQFGYQIDSDAPVYDDANLRPTGDDVYAAAGGTGADTASRMNIAIPIEGLTGTHSIYVLYKNAAGVEVLLNVITLVMPANWDEDKSVVIVQAFDGVHKNGTEESIIPAGCMPFDWDGVATMAATDTSLHYFGWLGVKGELGQFGYQIDRNAPVFDDANLCPTGDDVLVAAGAMGSDSASRMNITIPIEGLTGTHTIYVLYKNDVGIQVILNTITLVMP